MVDYVSCNTGAMNESIESLETSQSELERISKKRSKAMYGYAMLKRTGARQSRINSQLGYIRHLSGELYNKKKEVHEIKEHLKGKDRTDGDKRN